MSPAVSHGCVTQVLLQEPQSIMGIVQIQPVCRSANHGSRLMVTMMFVSELNAIRQKNFGLERDFIKAQKVVIIPALLPPPQFVSC